MLTASKYTTRSLRISVYMPNLTYPPDPSSRLPIMFF